MFGYAGRILFVNLSKCKTRVEEVSESFCRTYIGGNGFSVKLLHEHSPPGVDPLSPENPLIFATGPLTGTIAPSSGKHIVQAKSPLTGLMGESISSGLWGPTLKWAGYDALVVEGVSERPVYLVVEGDGVRFEDADHLWGEGTRETCERVRREVGGKPVSVVSIGPAGENLVKFACVSTDGYRHAGRTGMGAVMGSKRVKAIAVVGGGSVEVADLDGLMEECLRLIDEARGEETRVFRVYGTPAMVARLNRMGVLPTRNWSQSVFEEAERLTAEYLKENFYVRDMACPGCPIACDHVASADGVEVGVDYEILYAFGSNWGIGDFEAVCRVAELCDQLGMDAISAGETVAWAVECYERGIISNGDTGGLELRFGDPEVLEELLRMIAYRKGFGNVLAEGSKRASEVVGRGSEGLTVCIKGLELPGYDVRGLKLSALAFSTSTRGGCHMRASPYMFDVMGKVDRLRGCEEYGRIVKEMEDKWSLMDSLMLCKFARAVIGTYEEMLSLYRLTTGIDMDMAEFKRAGERIYNLEKLYNVREGWKPSDDTPPERMLREPIRDGVSRGSVITVEEFRAMYRGYCRERGWTEDGYPTEEKIRELGLEAYKP